MFAYLMDEQVHVVTYNREPAAAAAAVAAAGSDGRSATAAAAAAAVPLPVGLPASSSQLPGGHHGREILAAVMLQGPTVAAAAAETAAAAAAAAVSPPVALLTASEDVTVRAVVLRSNQQQQKQLLQQQDYAEKPTTLVGSSSSSSNVCEVSCDAGSCVLEGHLLGSHSSGVAVRCLDAAAIPAAAAAGRSTGNSLSTGWEQEQQSWLVVAGCAQEVLLVWQVHWQQQQQQQWQQPQQPQQQQWHLGWRLLSSKAPSRGLRPAPQAAGSASSSSDARHLAVAIVAVKRLELASQYKPDDSATTAAAADGSSMVALVAVSLSDGRLQLLQLSLPDAAWQTLAVLQPSSSSSSSSFSHPVLCLSMLRLPMQQCNASSAGSSNGPDGAYLLAAGGSDGQAYVFDVTAAVSLLQQQQPQEVQAASKLRGPSSSSSASTCDTNLVPLLQLPGLHQSGINDLQLVALADAKRSQAEVAAETCDAAACQHRTEQQHDWKEQQQQQQQRKQELLLVTGGDDQALVVTQLAAVPAFDSSNTSSDSISVSSTRSSFNKLTVVGSATCSNAHTSAIRGIHAIQLQHSQHGSSSRCSSERGAHLQQQLLLLLHSVGLDQQVRSWKVQTSSSNMSRLDAGSVSATAAPAASRQQQHQQSSLWLIQLGACVTEVPEPAAICGLFAARQQRQQQEGRDALQLASHGVLAVAGRGMQLMQQEFYV
jgi:hypothetical protein